MSSGTPSWGAPVTLFDGKTLDGWKLRDPKAKMGWAVVDGELAVVEPKGNADLVTDKAFQDIEQRYPRERLVALAKAGGKDNG